MENLNESQSHELQIVQTTGASIFGAKDIFEHSQRVSTMLSKSALVPKDYQNNVANCMIALEMANRIGASPLMVMQNLYIVHGRPAWSSQFLIATLNASKKFSPLRYEESEKDGGSTRAYATDINSNETLYGAWVSMEMAQAEGWINKNGSKWKTMPELMRRYRAAAFFTRQFAPEVSMGIMTYEEAHDVTHIQPVVQTSKINSERKRMEDMVNDCESIAELKYLQEQNPEIDIELINKRMVELEPVQEGGDND